MSKVITLCGSSRFPQAFELANMHLSLQGHIVIGLSCYGHADTPVGAKFLTSDGNEAAPEKQALDQLHFRKIDRSDEIFVVNVGGYIGSSTKREIAYAEAAGKVVRFMFSDPAPQPNVDVEVETARVVQSVNEWDDRTSPDDYPDHLLITSEELTEILRSFAATLEGRDNG